MRENEEMEQLGACAQGAHSLQCVSKPDSGLLLKSDIKGIALSAACWLLAAMTQG